MNGLSEHARVRSILAARLTMLRLRRTALALALIIPIPAAASAQSKPPTSPPDESAADAQPAHLEARRDYEQGRAHYALGEYPEAIALFRKAYELSAAPGLLFDIAQAYRLEGNCSKAIELYRHFARLAPESPRRGDAEEYEKNLTAQCEPPPPRASLPEAPRPIAATPAVATVDTRAPKEVPARTAPTARLGWALLGAGLGVGLGAGALYQWNSDRFSTWQREDHLLSMPPPAGSSSQEVAASQNTNDDLLRSIHSADHAFVALVSVSAVCVAGAAVVALLRSERAPDVALRSDGFQLSWAFP